MVHIISSLHCLGIVLQIMKYRRQALHAVWYGIKTVLLLLLQFIIGSGGLILQTFLLEVSCKDEMWKNI
jgi:hypothetical protein